MIDKNIRLANFAIDLLAFLAITMGIEIVAYFIYPELLDENNKTMEYIAYAVYFLYYFVFELTAGRTIGKLLTKTIVVDINGCKPDAGRIFGRTLIRLIPFDALRFLFIGWNTRYLFKNKAHFNRKRNRR